MNQLITLRNEIDLIDDELLSLLKKRLQIVTFIKKYKQLNHLPVSDPKRENEILLKLKRHCTPDEWVYLQGVFLTIFKTSKDFQND